MFAVVELETPIPPVFSEVKIDDAGIQRHQFVVASSIQRQILHLLLAHKS